MDNSSLVIRPVGEDDLGILEDIAKTVGPGFTSIPNDKVYLEKKLERVIQSFAGSNNIQDRLYLFVLEDTSTNIPIGTCGIQASVSCNFPLYNFELSTIAHESKCLKNTIKHKVIKVVNKFKDTSEIESLFIYPEQRGNNRGKLLSRARFLFIASFKQLFSDTIISEIRGVSENDGYTPFWDAVCRPFFHMDFKEAYSHINAVGTKFIADSLPKCPLYLAFIPKVAQDVIGKPHDSAQAAKFLLEKQGFSFGNYIDIFTGAPLLEAKTNSIKVVKESLSVAITIENSIDSKAAKEVMICNEKLDFRLCLAKISTISKQKITIDTTTAEKLRVTKDDKVRYCLFS